MATGREFTKDGFTVTFNAGPRDYGRYYGIEIRAFSHVLGSFPGREEIVDFCKSEILQAIREGIFSARYEVSWQRLVKKTFNPEEEIDHAVQGQERQEG